MVQEDVITIIVTSFLVSFLVILGAVLLLVFVQKERRRKQQEIFQAVLEAQTQEQKRVGQDLHDDVGPMLAGIYNQLELYASEQQPKNSVPGKLNQILQQIQDTSKAIRKASHELIPVNFDSMTLAEALEDNLLPMNTQNFQVRLPDLAPKTNLSNNQKSQLLKIAKELVLNAIKHSAGTEVIICLAQEQQETTLSVTDNGKGFPKSLQTHGSGVGLQNISNRLTLIKGTLKTSSSPTGGAHIVVTVKN